ncbi:SLC13 family permease [Prauserella cavernicola]|uniref:Arsenic transporter n=1 Tax=Prauserella cavernicola TaxID=2800127 RepID=A0A934V1K2_9PSEU|nr:SLC13 family permease [Prauserella cavernicola]MBK1783296.1 arsenic transporter [Prauserella cavernicola]
MSSGVAEVVALAALLAVLVFAVVRPLRVSESVVAIPAAGLVLAVGAISVPDALNELGRLAPVVGFLAAVLVLGRLCEDAGLFRAAGSWLARAGAGRPQVLLLGVFGIATATTALLSLDATVVLLTPAVLAMARRLRVPASPHTHACAHLANSASLLLPVSNLTNLLALSASGVSFLRFTALMALPTVLVVAAEYVLLRRFFARDLAVAPTPAPEDHEPRVPTFVLVVLAGTLAGFAGTSLLGWSPAWAALAGVVVLGVRSLRLRQSTVSGLARSVGVPFLVFVLALGVIVRAVVDNGLGEAAGTLLPDGTSLPALLGLAVVAAVLANLVNNLPAVLMLLPLVASGGTGAVLAVLVGVNIGPNLTYVGSLATLLWRRVLHEHDVPPRLRTFSVLGALTVPVTLVLAVVGLWASLRVIG